MRNPGLGSDGGSAPEPRPGGRRRFGGAWRAGALFGILGLLACTPGPPGAPAGAGASTAPAAAVPTAAAPLRMVGNWTAPTHAMMPLWVAQDYGLFREQGLDVELLNVPGT